MKVAVGSENPVKVDATAGAFGDLASSIDAVEVDSGVSEQPATTAETVQGATNRARRANAAGDYEVRVGIEGGVASVANLDGLYLTMWAAVDDGSDLSLGSGPRIRLPDSIAAAVRDGRELGPLLDAVLGTEDLKKGKGAVGVFTQNRIGREDALRQAVAVALGPLVSEHSD